MPDPKAEQARLNELTNRREARSKVGNEERSTMAMEQVADALLEIRDALRDLRNSVEGAIRVQQAAAARQSDYR